MSTLRATLPSKMKRLINPNNKTLGLSEEDKSDPVKVIQALVKRFGGSVSVQAERTKLGRMFQFEGESISAWECRVVERSKYCEYGNFEDQACRDRFIAGLVDETLQGKLNTNGHRNKDGSIVEFRTVVEIAKNYESSTDARRLMRQVRAVEIKSRSIGLKKHPSQRKTALALKTKAMAKSRLEDNLSVTTVGRHRVTQKKSVVQFSLSISAENVAKKGMLLGNV